MGHDIFEEEERQGLFVEMRDVGGLDAEEWCWICGFPWLVHREDCPSMRLRPEAYKHGAFALSPEKVLGV